MRRQACSTSLNSAGALWRSREPCRRCALLIFSCEDRGHREEAKSPDVLWRPCCPTETNPIQRVRPRLFTRPANSTSDRKLSNVGSTWMKGMQLISLRSDRLGRVMHHRITHIHRAPALERPGPNQQISCFYVLFLLAHSLSKFGGRISVCITTQYCSVFS